MREALILAIIVILIGCEIGDNREILAGNSTESGAIYSPLIKGRVDPSEIRKIFSQRGVPGYYIQVGYFQEAKPSKEFIDRMESSVLPYKILKKYRDGKVGYHVLLTP